MITHTGSVGPFMVSITQPEQAPASTPAEPRMQVGVNVSLADYGHHWPKYPGASIAAVFCEPGDGLLPWSHPKFAGLPDGIEPHIRYKDDVPEKALDAHMAGLPKRFPRVRYTSRHEPEGDLPVTDYRNRWRRLANVANGNPNRPRILLVAAQTLQWTASKAKGKGAGDFRIWWPSGYADRTGWDCYPDSWAAAAYIARRGVPYPDVDEFLTIPLAAQKEFGVPLELPEAGVVKMAEDPTGLMRADWMRTLFGRLRDTGVCTAVSWWCAMGKPGARGEVRDFHLADEPSCNALREAIALQ